MRAILFQYAHFKNANRKDFFETILIGLLTFHCAK